MEEEVIIPKPAVMRRFKPGDKVIFAPRKKINNPRLILPRLFEEVTISSLCKTHYDSYDIKEYPRAILGNFQSLNDHMFITKKQLQRWLMFTPLALQEINVFYKSYIFRQDLYKASLKKKKRR